MEDLIKAFLPVESGVGNELAYPEVGKSYPCYDDGKVRFSRLGFVEILGIVKFKEVSEGLQVKIKERVEEADYLFRQNIANLVIALNGLGQKECFLPTLDGGWFSLGYWGSGRIDVDGRLSRWLLSEIPNMDKNVLSDYKEVIDALAKWIETDI